MTFFKIYLILDENLAGQKKARRHPLRDTFSLTGSALLREGQGDRGKIS